MTTVAHQPIAPPDCYFVRSAGGAGWHLVSKALGALHETARCGQAAPSAGWQYLATILQPGQIACERCLAEVRT